MFTCNDGISFQLVPIDSCVGRSLNTSASVCAECAPFTKTRFPAQVASTANEYQYYDRLLYVGLEVVTGSHERG